MSSMLLTGASGFIGANILPRLREDYERITTLGLSAANDVAVDLSREVPRLRERVDVVLHAAGLAHFVPSTQIQERLFYNVNVEGTKNLCRALETVGVPQAFIYVSSVAVYGAESGTMIDESHPLMGSSAYAKSKILSEKYLTHWASRHGITLTILRPSIMAGKNPPGNLGAMINALRRGFYFNIAGNDARKSIMMADDLVELVAKVKSRGGIYNVCDSEHPSMNDVSLCLARELGVRNPVSVPYPLVNLMARVGDIAGGGFPINSARLRKLTTTLTFSNQKAVDQLGWTPRRVLDNMKV